MSDYADPNCSLCRGNGFIYGKSMLTGGRFCDCTLDAIRLENMGKIWESLPDTRDIPELRKNPPLLKLTARSLWITGPSELFKRHLKAVAFNKGTLWDAKVRSDAELLDSWFATAKSQGVKIFDMEVERSTIKAIDIRDLVEPPDLCIIVLGVKQLPNKEACNALLEALGYRQHVGKPTWLVDQVDHPINDPYHRFFSETLMDRIKRWPHIFLTATGAKLENEPNIQHAVASGSVEIDSLLEESKEMRVIDHALSDIQVGQKDQEFTDSLLSFIGEIESKPEAEADEDDIEDPPVRIREREYQQDRPTPTSLLDALAQNEQKQEWSSKKKPWKPGNRK